MVRTREGEGFVYVGQWCMFRTREGEGFVYVGQSGRFVARKRKKYPKKDRNGRPIVWSAMVPVMEIPPLIGNTGVPGDCAAVLLRCRRGRYIGIVAVVSRCDDNQ
jgi:hypothetical protein